MFHDKHAKHVTKRIQIPCFTSSIVVNLSSFVVRDSLIDNFVPEWDRTEWLT